MKWRVCVPGACDAGYVHEKGGEMWRRYINTGGRRWENQMLTRNSSYSLQEDNPSKPFLLVQRSHHLAPLVSREHIKTHTQQLHCKVGGLQVEEGG